MGGHCRDYFAVTPDLAGRIAAIDVDVATDASDHQPLRLGVAALSVDTASGLAGGSPPVLFQGRSGCDRFPELPGRCLRCVVSEPGFAASGSLRWPAALSMMARGSRHRALPTSARRLRA